MTMEKIQLLTELLKSNQNTDELSSALVLGLKSGVLSFLELTEQLECLLTNTDIVLRRGGSEILSTLLEQLPLNYLKSQEIELLANFYCDRMLDHHSITPAVLKGFLALLNMENLPAGIASKIFTTMNLHFVAQSQTQPDRLLCYEILNTMMVRKPKELQALGPDFVCGYLSAVDSERDPRNLMYLFRNLPYFFQTFPPGHLIEDAFEAASCYFPIDFRANPNDPRGISRDDLSSTLLPCLTAIPEFSPFVVPLALEKLSSDLQVAKIDSLVLLKECFNNFSKSDLCSHVDEIVSALLRELRLGGIKEDLYERVVEVLVHIVKYFSNNELSENVDKILNQIYSSVHHFLNDIHLSTFQQAVQFLTQISSASDTSSRFVAIKVIPKLLAINCGSSRQSVKLLLSIKSILLPCIFYGINCDKIPELQDSWSQIPQLFLKYSICDDFELKLTAIEGCTLIVKLLNIEERRLFYSILCKNVTVESDTKFSFKCMNCLKHVAENYSEEVHEAIKSYFELSNEKTIEQQKQIIQCYCVLSTIPEFLIYLERTIKFYVRNDSSEFAGFVIESLRNTVVSENRDKNFLNTLHHKINVTKYLMNWWHDGCNAIADDVITVYDDEQIAANLKLVLSIIIRELEKQSQREIANRYFQLTLDYSKRFMNSFAYLNMNNDFNAPKVHCSLSIITFESIVNGLLPIVLEESFEGCLTQIIKYLITLSVYCSRTLCCLVACRSIATVFNKLPSNSNFENELSHVLSAIRSVLLEKSSALRINVVNLLLHVTKSLLLRGYINVNVWCDQLVELIGSEDVGNSVAQGFRLISEENEYFLSDSCHCTVKLFYRQRVFSYVIPKLIELHQKSDPILRKRCAVSTLYLLNGIPQAVIEKNFKKIVPLLIELLEISSESALTNEALQKLAEILASNPSLFEEYVETFIPKLLTLSRFANEMNVRIAALECLCSYSKLNLTVLLPFKTKVLQELSHCLDDKKRLVRKKAVKTRTRWFVIGVL